MSTAILYFIVATLTILFIAWIGTGFAKRHNQRTYFSSRIERYQKDAILTWSFISGAFWPVAIPLLLVFGTVWGMVTVVEYILNKTIWT